MLKGYHTNIKAVVDFKQHHTIVSRSGTEQLCSLMKFVR